MYYREENLKDIKFQLEKILEMIFSGDRGMLLEKDDSMQQNMMMHIKFGEKDEGQLTLEQS